MVFELMKHPAFQRSLFGENSAHEFFSFVHFFARKALLLESINQYIYLHILIYLWLRLNWSLKKLHSILKFQRRKRSLLAVQRRWPLRLTCPRWFLHSPLHFSPRLCEQSSLDRFVASLNVSNHIQTYPRSTS